MADSYTLPREEYVEQAYFFATLRDRLTSAQPAQEILRHLVLELLAATRLPMAVQFMLDELKHCGQLGEAFARLRHYFTPFQAHVIREAERDASRFSFDQALLILEREARYRADGPTPAGLFAYQFETLSRNSLGFDEGLRCMERDGFFDESWREFIRVVRSQLGLRELSELIFARSHHFVVMRRRQDPSYTPPFVVLFEEKEGRIAAANIGKDPMYLFATLQRQLGYPEVPRPPKPDPGQKELDELGRRLHTLEMRLSVLEAEVTGKTDMSKFVISKPEFKAHADDEA